MTCDVSLRALYRELSEFEDEHVLSLEKKIAQCSARKNE
jgi:hypothetical protein